MVGEVCIRNIDKLNMIWWFDLRLKPIFTTVPATSREAIHFKRGQRLPKNNNLAFLKMIMSKSLIHTVGLAFGF